MLRSFVNFILAEHVLKFAFDIISVEIALFSSCSKDGKHTNLPRIDDPCVALATVSKTWLEQNPLFYLYLINIYQACLT